MVSYTWDATHEWVNSFMPSVPYIGHYPVQEKDIQGRYFGLIYFSDERRKKGRPFVGKVLRRFHPNKDSAIYYLEMVVFEIYSRSTNSVREKPV